MSNPASDGELNNVPVLERLCPLPGTVRAGTCPVGSHADERVGGKISALLAQAEFGKAGVLAATDVMGGALLVGQGLI